MLGGCQATGMTSPRDRVAINEKRTQAGWPATGSIYVELNSHHYTFPNLLVLNTAHVPLLRNPISSRAKLTCGFEIERGSAWYEVVKSRR